MTNIFRCDAAVTHRHHARSSLWTMIFRGSLAALAFATPAAAADSQSKREAAEIGVEPAESYQPKGIEFGSFLMLPLLDVSQHYNDNVFASATDRRSDWITRIAPEVKFRSRFTNHQLNLKARAEQSFYREYTADDHLDLNLAADGRYDIDRNWKLTGLLDASQAHEDRGSPDDVGGKEQTQVRTGTSQVGTETTFGRFGFKMEGEAIRRDYRDVEGASGASVNQDDRDRDELRMTSELSYELFPGYSAVVEGSLNDRQYDDRLDDQQFNRSSHGSTLRAGIGVDISELVRGDFLVGYMNQNYEDARFKTIDGISMKASFNWTPSRMTVVIPTLERSIQETTTTNASGMLRTGGSLTVRHELQRNIILTAIGSAYNEKYRGTTRDNWSYDSRLRGQWFLSPNYYVGGEVGYRERTSKVDSEAFHQTVILFRIGTQL